NWCAFIVQKNVSCAVRADIPESARCPPHQPDCEPSVMYQTHFQPSYRISYKTVTELEWRCCPGYQGPDCRELKGTPNRQMLLKPQPQPHNGYIRNSQRPDRQETGRHDPFSGVEKTRQLEEEVQRLSQTVLDLQAAMTSMTSNLRTDIQEDTSKMLATLLTNMHVQDSAKTGGIEESSVHLDGHQATRGLEDRGMEKVLARLNDVTDALKSKDEAIEELREAVTGHSGQIRMLMDASQGPTITAGASTDIDILEAYIDTKFEKLKKELVADMKDEVEKLMGACDEKILSFQKTCKEGLKSSYDNLTNLLGNQEAVLRKEMRELRLDMVMSDGLVRTHRQTIPFKADGNDLQKTLGQLIDAHQILNARVDNELEHLSTLKLDDIFGPRMDELEARMNVTERNAETYCFYVDEKLTKALAEEAAKIQKLLNEKLSSVEEEFTSMLIEMSNTSFPGMFSESVDGLQNQVNANKYVIQGLELKLNAIENICATDCKSSPSSPDPQHLRRLESITVDVRQCRNQLDVLSTSVENGALKLSELEAEVDDLKLENRQNGVSIRDVQNKLTPLTDNVSGLTGSVTGLGDVMSRFSQDLENLNSSCCQGTQTEPVQIQSAVPPVSHEGSKPSHSQVEELSNRLQSLESQVTTEMALCKEKARGVAEGISALGSRITTLEGLCGKVNDERTQVQDMKEGLERHLAQMNSTLQMHSREISNLQHNLQNVKTQQQGVPVKPDKPSTVPDSRTFYPPRRPHIPEIHIPLLIPQRPVPVPPYPAPRQPHGEPSIPRQPYAPPRPSAPHLQPHVPVVVTGVAGPPGYEQRVPSRRERGSHELAKPVSGFAGRPGHLPINPVAYKPHPMAASQALWNPTHRLVATPVSPERNMFVEPISFSAGLTEQPLLGDFGIIQFNKVLVNDGGHYNPQT
ncbi:EMILIN-2-like, partial [Clarias magur]